MRRFGRKSLLTAGSFIICLSYLAIGLCIHWDWAPGVLLFLLTFNMGFQPSYGTLTHLYNAEISVDKAASINTSNL